MGETPQVEHGQRTEQFNNVIYSYPLSCAMQDVDFDINRSMPSKIFLTDGKGAERPFVNQILDPGQTGVRDRCYQCHKNFDAWQNEGKLFACRIKANTTRTCIKNNELKLGSSVFYDSNVLLGTPGDSQTKKELRVVGYRIDNIEYWVATNRYDLSGEQVALVYKLRWEIEKFFAWWKHHLQVYHLIARSEYGLMAQILSGRITYLLLAIYCHNEHNEKVSVKRVRELRIKMINEAGSLYCDSLPVDNCNNFESSVLYAKT